MNSASSKMDFVARTHFRTACSAVTGSDSSQFVKCTQQVSLVSLLNLNVCVQMSAS